MDLPSFIAEVREVMETALKNLKYKYYIYKIMIFKFLQYSI